MSQIEIPDFASEAEEAAWWFENQEQLDDDFLKAAEEGRLGVGTAARLANLPTALVEIDKNHVEIARQQAEKRGVQYHAYVTTLLHQALEQDAKAS